MKVSGTWLLLPWHLGDPGAVEHLIDVLKMMISLFRSAAKKPWADR
jgi:hypothetical protein